MASAIVAALASRFARAPLERFADGVARALATSPDLDVAPDRFAQHLAARIGDDLDVALHVADLYLACGCLWGCSRAFVHFQREYLTAVPRILHSFPSAVVEDVVEILPERLIMGAGDRPPKLAQYSGKSRLRTWFKTVVIRSAQDAQRKRRFAVPIEDSASLMDAIGVDAERQHGRHMAASEFRLSLGRAIQSLSSEQRQLLHGMYVEGLTLRELGGPMRTDPSTTFYRLKRIYAILRQKIEADLRARLHLAANEVDSFVQSMLSGLELRITGLLGAPVE